MRFATILAAAALCATSCPALAWIPLDDDVSCAFGEQYDGAGKTMIVFSQSRSLFDIDGMTIVLTNSNWTLREEADVTDEIKLVSESGELGNKPIMRDGALVLAFPYPAVAQFMYGNPTKVRVMKGQQQIDGLNFSGALTAWLQFEDCRRKWRDEKAERERQEGLSKLPRDPFANDQ